MTDTHDTTHPKNSASTENPSPPTSPTSPAPSASASDRTAVTTASGRVVAKSPAAAGADRHGAGMLVLWLIVGLSVGAIVEYKFAPVGTLRGETVRSPTTSAPVPIVDFRPTPDPVQLDLFNTSEALAAAIEFASQSVVSISARSAVERPNPLWGVRPPTESLGSGVVLRVADPIVYVVTNNHVIANAQSVRITYQEFTVDARVVGTDPATDLAVVAARLSDFPTKPRPAVWIDDAEIVRPGHLVVAIGSPSGYSNSATLGIISATGRSGPQSDAMGYADDIQTSAPINRGNSGGPLVNVRGRVVGINTWKLRESEGMGFAIPAYLVKRVATDLIDHGAVRRAALGVKIRALREAEHAHFGSGVVVDEVLPNSPAAKAGLQPNDIIRAIADKPIHNVRELKTRIAHHYPGDHIALIVLREGREITLPVFLGIAE